MNDDPMLSSPGWSGHYWTLTPRLRDWLVPLKAPPAERIRFELDDPRLGALVLTGELRQRPSDTLLLLVHGLGGSADSPYMRRTALAAERQSVASLRLSLRGADGRGEDFYHAGLTQDLERVCADPRLRRYRHIAVLGFSLGGHLCLRWASESLPERVRAVAAICPPIDLRASADVLDERVHWIYRSYILRSLQSMYARVLERHGGRHARSFALSAVEARQIRTIRDWDERIVAKRHGFSSAEHYWAETMVAGRLDRITTPTLVVSSPFDPMVFHETVRTHLDEATNVERVYVRPGGHVGFAPWVDLGFGDRGTVADQVIGWLLRAARE